MNAFAPQTAYRSAENILASKSVSAFPARSFYALYQIISSSSITTSSATGATSAVSSS